MSKSKRRQLTDDEQQVLDLMQVRLLTSPQDKTLCDQLIVKHHYLKDATLVGEQLRYVVTYKDHWLALATWSAAAFHLKDRDDFIGWDFEQCRRRRALLANNSRLLVLPECHYPNLISRFMKLMLGRLSSDWLEHWGHPLALVETFVDPQLYQGTAYKVSGWSHLGKTAGWKRDAADFYTKHHASKQIWVRELVKKSCVKLRAQTLPDEWAMVEADARPRCTRTVKEIQGLMEALRQNLPEFRRAQALGYPVAGLVALTVMAMATGARKGPDDLADYADTLSQAQLRTLNFRRDQKSGLYRCPKRGTFIRFLAEVDAGSLETLLLQWQQRLIGPIQDNLVIVDGKKMRHGKVEMVNATNGKGHYLGGVITPAKSNEIPAARQVLGKLDLQDKIALTDALHTNVETAQLILFEKGADYLMTVKANQPILQKTLQDLFEKRVSPPSGPAADPGAQTGAQSRPVGNSRGAMPGCDSQSGELSGGQAGGAIGNARQTRQEVVTGSGVSDQQSDTRAIGSQGPAAPQTQLLGC